MAGEIIDLQIVSDGFKRGVAEFPGILYRRMRTACEQAAMLVKKQTILTRLSGPRGIALGRRTGALAKALQYQVFGNDLSNMGYTDYFDSNVAPYALLQEPPPEVSEIRPIGHPYLAVPMKDAMTPAGVVRTQYRAAPGASLRTVPGLFLVRKRAGSMFLAMAKGKKTLFLYVLKTLVRVPRRLRFLQLFSRLHAYDGGALRFLALGVRAAAEDWHRQGIR
jgi:hypothetical protein